MKKKIIPLNSSSDEDEDLSSLKMGENDLRFSKINSPVEDPDHESIVDDDFTVDENKENKSLDNQVTETSANSKPGPSGKSPPQQETLIDKKSILSLNC